MNKGNRSLKNPVTQRKKQKEKKKEEETFIMDLDAGEVGRVIGRAGSNIKGIERSSNCKIWLDQDVPNDHPRRLFFFGTKQCIDMAITQVNTVLSTSPVASPDRYAKHLDHESYVVDCPSGMVGLLIGRKGVTVQKIRMISGAHLSINQHVEEGFPRKVIVSGTKKSVILAIELVEEVLQHGNLLGESCLGPERAGVDVSKVKWSPGESNLIDNQAVGVVNYCSLTAVVPSVIAPSLCESPISSVISPLIEVKTNFAQSSTIVSSRTLDATQRTHRMPEAALKEKGASDHETLYSPTKHSTSLLSDVALTYELVDSSLNPTCSEETKVVNHIAASESLVSEDNDFKIESLVPSGLLLDNVDDKTASSLFTIYS